MGRIDRDDLPHSESSHSLVGVEHGLPISLILVHAPPGTGPELHRHPYPEVFVLEAGRATFHVDGADVLAEAGDVVVAPAGAMHGFKNAGQDELRLTAIHTAPEFTTEWLNQPDPAWASASAS
jgi:quercetin dioxygenase-like cupin family protein